LLCTPLMMALSVRFPGVVGDGFRRLLMTAYGSGAPVESYDQQTLDRPSTLNGVGRD
jgi:hypothetical protein